MRSKVWQLFIILPVPLGSKKLKGGGGGGIVCMRYYPTGCHSDVGGAGARRAKLVGRSEKTRRGLAVWGGEVLLKELYGETELIKLSNKLQLFFFFRGKNPTP